MKVKDLIKKDLIIDNIRSKDKEGAIEEALKMLLPKVDIKNGSDIIKTLLDREELGSTGIGNNIAIPHARVEEIDGIVSVFARSREGIDFNSLDGKPVHLLFLVLSGEDATNDLLNALSQISKLLLKENVKENLLNARDKEELYKIIYEEGSKIES